jgi:hypothetical protein
MNANPKSVLFEEALTRSVIGAFYDVHRVLGFGFREHIYALPCTEIYSPKVIASIVKLPSPSSYLTATALELGLLLHFGREPTFSRVICENRLKRHPRWVQSRNDQGDAGCCWVRQCRVPSPHTRSTAWMPTTSRPGNSSASVLSAVRSFGSLKVGTITTPFAM